MARPRPRKTRRYGDRFKATAIKLSSVPGVLVQDVAAAVDIHPFMLSLWRKQVRDGVIVAKAAKLDVQTKAKLKRLRELERQIQGSQRGARAPKKRHPVCFGSKAEVFEFIEANRTRHKVSVMCRVYGVTRAGYYDWRKRQPSARTQQDGLLQQQIERVHQESGSTYGSPRVHRELKTHGVQVGENRVARLMRLYDIKARAPSRRFYRAHMKRFHDAIENRAYGLKVERPDQVWVGDVTYLKVGGVYRYLALVMDKYSRRVLGWAFGKTREVTLTLRALNEAVRKRCPPRGLIFHSDHGMEYSSGRFSRRLARRWYRAEHEPAAKDERQRAHRVILPFDEDRHCARGSFRRRSRNVGRGAQLPAVLQQQAVAFFTWIRVAGDV